MELVRRDGLGREKDGGVELQSMNECQKKKREQRDSPEKETKKTKNKDNEYENVHSSTSTKLLFPLLCMFQMEQYTR